MSDTLKLYGARYYEKGVIEIEEARPGDYYHFTAYMGDHGPVEVDQGDSLITLSPDKSEAQWLTGRGTLDVADFGVVLRGYNCGDKTASLDKKVNLPYVNGCATRQIFPPERPGDPTFQQLTIPPHTSEQQHHIHATVRVVFVLDGKGWSVVGQPGKMAKSPLLPGMTCILDPMCPHHFETDDDYLTVLPVHIWSSTVLEGGHPMMHGTKEV